MGWLIALATMSLLIAALLIADRATTRSTAHAMVCGLIAAAALITVALATIPVKGP